MEHLVQPDTSQTTIYYGASGIIMYAHPHTHCARTHTEHVTIFKQFVPFVSNQMHSFNFTVNNTKELLVNGYHHLLCNKRLSRYHSDFPYQTRAIT